MGDIKPILKIHGTSWLGVPIKELVEEFKNFEEFKEIGPLINNLIDRGYTENNGRSAFHIRLLQNEFNQSCVDKLIEILCKD